MSAPKAGAAGLTVERREELRRLAEMIDERMNLHAQSHRNSNSPNVFYCSPGCVSQQLRLVVEDVFGRVLAAAEAERDEARAAVERESGQPSRAKVWEEALEAVAWTMSTGGPPDLAYVAEHNPYRAASSEGA